MDRFDYRYRLRKSVEGRLSQKRRNPLLATPKPQAIEFSRFSPFELRISVKNPQIYGFFTLGLLAVVHIDSGAPIGWIIAEAHNRATEFILTTLAVIVHITAGYRAFTASRRWVENALCAERDVSPASVVRHATPSRKNRRACARRNVGQSRLDKVFQFFSAPMAVFINIAGALLGNLIDSVQLVASVAIFVAVAIRLIRV
jgi:hypothetical protein